jgi:hypothetical protein
MNQLEKKELEIKETNAKLLNSKKELKRNPSNTDALVEVEHYQNELASLEADKEWLKMRVEEEEKKRGI